MNASDFIFKSIYDGVIAKGASKKSAQNAAEIGTLNYKRGDYAKKPKNLIEDAIKSVKKPKKVKK